MRRLDAAFIPGKWQERVSGLSGRACTNAGDLQYQGGLGAVFVALDRELHRYAHTKTSSSRRPTRRGPARCARPTRDWGWHWGRSNISARWSVSTNLDVQNRPENGQVRRELLLTPLTFLRTFRDDLHGDPDARPEGQLPVRQEPERLSFNVNYCFGNICAMIGDSF